MATPALCSVGLVSIYRPILLGSLQRLEDSSTFPPTLSPAAILQRGDTTDRIPRLQEDLTEHIHNTRLSRFIPPHLSQTTPRASNAPESFPPPPKNRDRFLPSSQPEGTFVEPEVWITMIDLRTCNPLFSGDRECPQCQEGRSDVISSLDALGFHAATSPGGFGTTRRHNSVCRFLYRKLRRSGSFLTSYHEKPLRAALLLPRQQQRRMDLVMDDLDFAPHPGSISLLYRPNAAYRCVASSTPAGAALKAEDRKRVTYDSACTFEGTEVFPVAIDIYGAIGLSARAAFQTIEAHLSRIRGSNPAAEYIRLLIPTLSRSQQATAVAINRRRLAHPYPLRVVH